MKLQYLYNHFWAIAGAVSVRTKILGIVLGLVFLLGLGITLQVRATLSRTMDAQLQDQSISVTRDLAARATDFILLNDIFALHQLLSETVMNNANVRYAFILDTQGHVLAHTFGDEFPLDLLEINTISATQHHHTAVIETNEGYVWDTAVPIFEGRAGTARVGLSDAGVQRAVQTVTGQLLLTTILVSVFGITAATFLTWILTRPILDLAKAAQNVARGDFSQQVQRWAHDEIGELAGAFNHMTAELARTDEIRRERELLRRQLLEKVITAQEDERRRIARELHDSTSQTLTSLLVGLRMLENHCSVPAVQLQASELREIAAQTLEEVHDLSMQLRPRILDDLGLAAALERLVADWSARYKIPVDLLIHLGEERLPGPVETALYRIVQETLTNVARHAQAHSASVLIERRNGEVVTVVEDDGSGFEVKAVQGERQLGLLGMRERAELLGGRLTIESIPEMGTSVFVRIPLQEQEAN
jgi:signal transduction histidine kinase